MAEKVFIQRDSFQLVSDERDIMLPLSLTNEVHEWCVSNNVIAEQKSAFGVTLWRVKDYEQRMWFALRWA